MNTIERLEALAEKATGLPWSAEEGYHHEVGLRNRYKVWFVGSPYPHGIAELDMDAPEDNARFIVAAINALPDLLKLARAAEEANIWMAPYEARQHLPTENCPGCKLSRALEPLLREVEP